MANFKIEKVLLLPETLSPNTIYLLPGAQIDTFNIFVSDNTGTSVRNLNIPQPQEPISREVNFVYDPNGVEVESNDDYDNRGSFISYVALETGTYSMHIGCYADDYCTGVVAWEVLPTE